MAIDQTEFQLRVGDVSGALASGFVGLMNQISTTTLSYAPSIIWAEVPV